MSPVEFSAVRRDHWRHMGVTEESAEVLAALEEAELHEVAA